MFCQIKTAKNIDQPIRYNEKKVREGQAKCIHAGNFLKEAHQLGGREKMAWFRYFLDLNRHVKRSVLHISLSFDPSEHIPEEKLVDIAREYMDRIGSGYQPCLVYEHFDSAHPHLHIVSITIRADGSSIPLHFIGRDRSEPARKVLEDKYGLVKAQQEKKAPVNHLKPLPVEKLQYGRRPTKEAITHVLEYILENYRYRSLPELNAILRLYNLKADPGKPGGQMHRNGGLLYQMLNDKGQAIGVPIKAGSIYFKPGLQWLERKFQANQALDRAAVLHIQWALDAALQQRPKDWSALTEALRREQIAPAPGKTPLSDLHFVDLAARLVVNAGDLGEHYSPRSILQRLGLGSSQSQNKTLEILFRPEEQAQRMPHELSQKTNKKKKSQHL